MTKEIKRVVIIGAGIGDEGKGKLANLLSQFVDLVLRYQGSANAGHTNVDKKGEIVSHQLPAGLLNEVYSFISAGGLLDPIKLLDEINVFRKRGYKVTKETLGISELIHVSLDHHFEEEKISEASNFSIGTTFSKITPTTSAKVNRMGIRFCEFLDPESFKSILPKIIKAYSEKGINVSLEDYLKKYKSAQEQLAEFSVRDEDIVEKFKHKKWLYEGAQGTLLDIDWGMYPYITTSNPSRKGIPFDVDYVMLAIKTFTSSVGDRPKITLMDNETAKILRGNKEDIDGEFGKTSGRLRDLLWPDFVWKKYSVSINEADGIALTKLDKLSLVDKIKFCTSYIIDGKEVHNFPHDREKLARATPNYTIELDTFEDDISNIKNYVNLPKNAHTIVECFEDNLKTLVALLSLGTGKDQVIIRDHRLYSYMNIKQNK